MTVRAASRPGLPRAGWCGTTAPRRLVGFAGELAYGVAFFRLRKSEKLG